MVAAVGVSSGSNLGELGAGDAILVVASDLHEEAPVWWLRVKQAAERGAALVVVNARRHAAGSLGPSRHSLRAGQGGGHGAPVGQCGQADRRAGHGDALGSAADTLVNARNLVAFYGI